MEDGGDATEYRDPFGVACDDESDHVRVMIVIPSLKKAFAKNEPSDGGKVDFKVKERSFDMKLSVMMKDSGAKKLQHYRYQIHKLPADVLPNKSDYKVKDGKIIIRLYKAKKVSWQAVLSESGLETYDDEKPTEEDN